MVGFDALVIERARSPEAAVIVEATTGRMLDEELSRGSTPAARHRGAARLLPLAKRVLDRRHAPGPSFTERIRNGRSAL